MSQIDRRIQVNTIIENQLPEFLVSDFPNATEFFKQWDDYGVAALTGGLYKLTSFVGDRLIRGKRPGTIEISES